MTRAIRNERLLIFYKFLVLFLFTWVITACATASKLSSPSPEHTEAAKQFLHNLGLGEHALATLRQTIGDTAKKQPGLAEVMRRAFEELGSDDFEDLGAQVYARHLRHEHLTELVRFSESSTGIRFFKTVIASVLGGERATKEDLMRQFNADELTEIMRFAQSDASAALNRQLPSINQELAVESRRLGEAKIREYLHNQRSRS